MSFDGFSATPTLTFNYPARRVIAENILGQLTPSELELFSNVRVLIGVPCNCGLYPSFVGSLLNLTHVLDALKVNYDVHLLAGESLITRARNYLCAEALGGHYTHLFFIDADIGFAPDSLVRLILHGRAVIGVPYPGKCYDWEMIREKFKNGEAVEDVVPWPSRYIFNAVPGAKIAENGVAVAYDVPTGFLLIQTAVLRHLAKRGAAAAYVNDVERYETATAKMNFYDFFPTMIDPKTRRYLSEDYAFSRLCQMNGIEVFVDLSIPLSHSGQHTFGPGAAIKMCSSK
jgi:hypothetical protein